MAIITLKSEKNKIGNIEASIQPGVHELKSTEDILEVEGLYFNDYYDFGKLKSFIKKCEKQIRSSSEYSTYIGDLRNDKGMEFCAIRGYITDDDASIEFHHYPFTLYDIVYVVVIDAILKKEKFTSFSISSKVLDLHAKNLIGLVPLCKTEHKLVHDGVRIIPMKSVYGKVKEFVDLYQGSMDDEMIDKYNTLIKL